MNKAALLNMLGWVDPWYDFKPAIEPHLWSWGGTDSTLFLQQLVQQKRPQTLIEVGSWLGASAVDLVQACRAQGLDSCLLCVDTWLGSLEHWLQPELRYYLDLQQGYPHFYHRFLANLHQAEVHEQVIPVPMPSLIAARLLQHHEIQADLIYLDGSHEPHDVWFDLHAYWALLRTGGILAGDDWCWPGIADVLNRFCQTRNVHFHIEGVHWRIQK